MAPVIATASANTRFHALLFLQSYRLLTTAQTKAQTFTLSCFCMSREGPAAPSQPGHRRVQLQLRHLGPPLPPLPARRRAGPFLGRESRAGPSAGVGPERGMGAPPTRAPRPTRWNSCARPRGRDFRTTSSFYWLICKVRPARLDLVLARGDFR